MLRRLSAQVRRIGFDGVQGHRVRPILEAAIASFDQYRQLQLELDRTLSELADRKLIERAKGIVMKQRGIDEPAAYRLMRKTAMNQNQRLVELAKSILAAANLLGNQEDVT